MSASAVTCGRAGVRRADGRRAWLVAEAVLIAAVVRVAVRLLPLPRVVALLDRRRFRVTTSIDVSSCVNAAAAAAARIAHPTCLYRSLIAFTMLARRGAPVAFHLGAATAGGFSGHAWISMDGRALDADGAAWRDLWQHCAIDRSRR